MKLVSFEGPNGQGYGALDSDQIIRLDGAGAAANDLKSFLGVWDQGGFSIPEGAERIAFDSVRLLPPIPDPSKVFCVATNFREPGNADKTEPDFPLLFTRVAEAQTGHGAPILKPSVSGQFDFEGEMAVIIGRAGHKIARADAQDHIAGYACFNDGSVRDWQKHSTQLTPGKNFYQSAGFGPWLVTKDEVPDIAVLHLETRVNGVIKQAISLGQMIFDPSWLISYISTFSPLGVGDVIVTGTPSGFGATRKPKEFLSHGDVVEVEITGLGTLSNQVQQDIGPSEFNFRK